jgi:hypothetical protein
MCKKLRIIAAILTLAGLSCISASARADSFEKNFANWVLSGVQPLPPSAPGCGSDTSNFLGVFSQDQIDQQIEPRISQACRARRNRRGVEPAVFWGCYGVLTEPMDFNQDLTGEYRCYCDYFFCNNETERAFEKLVDLAIRLRR